MWLDTSWRFIGKIKVCLQTHHFSSLTSRKLTAFTLLMMMRVSTSQTTRWARATPMNPSVNSLPWPSFRTKTSRRTLITSHLHMDKTWAIVAPRRTKPLRHFKPKKVVKSWRHRTNGLYSSNATLCWPRKKNLLSLWAIRSKLTRSSTHWPKNWRVKSRQTLKNTFLWRLIRIRMAQLMMRTSIWVICSAGTTLLVKMLASLILKWSCET